MSDESLSAVPLMKFLARRPTRRVLGAVAVVLLLSTSGLLVAGLSGSAGAAAAPGNPAPMRPDFSNTGILTGPALQKAPLTVQSSSPLQTLPNVTALGAVAPSTPYSFTIGFQMQNEESLAELVQAQSTPGSPLFHQWLTLDQERTLYGPDPVAYQDTINYFTSLGFQVQTKGLLSVSFTGNVGQTDAAFHTTVENVSYGQGQTGSVNSEPLSLPAPIAKGVVSVNGLNPAGTAKPTSYVDPEALAEFGASRAVSDGYPVASPVAIPYNTATQGNLSTVFNFSQHGFFWFEHFSLSQKRNVLDQVITPGALSTMYNATALLNQGINGDSTGTPITIAIVMAGGINPTDMEAYSQLVWNNPNQIMNRLFPSPVDGSFGLNGTVIWADGASSEMALDIEFSSTMAPAAKIVPVYGPFLSTNVLDDDYATLENMAKVPNIISNSWGGGEDGWPDLYGPAYDNALTMHDYFMELDARGATIIASSGDGGGFDVNTGLLSGSFPATDPYVLAVNGLRTVAADASGQAFSTNTAYGILNTSIGVNPQAPISTLINTAVHADKTSQISSQTYWYEPFVNTTLTNTPPQGSGGFDSSYWFNQSWIEHGYGIPDLGRSLGSGVAGEADYNTSIFFLGSMQFFWGGTSFACPTTAGSLALIEDYLVDHGKSGLLGNGNGIAYYMSNAYDNGNVSLKPYYDIVTKPGVSFNGTSYWGNYGVDQGYEFPPGQKFPYNAQNQTTYGNTTPGWDFPTGFGSIIISNFAQDLLQLEQMPGTFMTVNSAGTAYDAGQWDYMTLNHTYLIDVNASSQIAATNPVVTVVFHSADGVTNTSFQPSLTQVITPSSGYRFTLDTSLAPFNTPGFVIFEFGNSTSHSIGFAYDWISYPILPGTLNITVVQPQGSQIISGYPEFNLWPSGYSAPITAVPDCCTNVPNTFTVHVTYNGVGVYNALVTAQIPSTTALAWQASRAYQATNSYGNPHEQAPTTLSWTYTNLTGFAVVYTWNLVKPTTYFVNATYGSSTAQTTFGITPGINVKTTDVKGGTYSAFNTISFILKNLRQQDTPQTEDVWAPNSVNQSGYYDLLYGWQGEILPVSTNNFDGTVAPGIHVWLGDYDVGGQNKFYTYQSSGGIRGVTNVTGTANNTDSNGNASIFIPDNQSDSNWFVISPTQSFGLAAVAASYPGQYNRTFGYFEKCFNSFPGAPNLVGTCEFNDSYQRNYSATPIVILPNPVNVTTQTPAGTARSFFGVGSNISIKVNVQLPDNDPFVTGYGYDWPAGQEHVVSVEAYVDGSPEADLTPPAVPQWQNFTINSNLTGNFQPGVHTLTIVTTDSEGHIFTRSHTFIMGSISVNNLNLSDTYTVLPYNLSWTYNIPSGQMNNHTFSQSLEIQYQAPGCGSKTDPCPIADNLTIRIKDGVTSYNQSLNVTLLHLQNFYAGSSEFPPGQYEVTVWLNANHSGSLATSVGTYFVFDQVQATIDGPSAGAVVPVGNLTISYAYSGEYISNATLLVTPVNSTVPVFAVGAFVPGLGGSLRGGAATWTSVTPGQYVITLALGTPYGHLNATENVTVSTATGLTFLNSSSPKGLFPDVAPATLGTILAIVAAIIGLILGLMVAPAMRGGPKGPASTAVAAAPVQPWQEDKGGSSTSGKPTCSVCHEQFETDFALHQHQKITHGIEE